MGFNAEQQAKNGQDLSLLPAAPARRHPVPAHPAWTPL